MYLINGVAERSRHSVESMQIRQRNENAFAQKGRKRMKQFPCLLRPNEPAPTAYFQSVEMSLWHQIDERTKGMNEICNPGY